MIFMRVYLTKKQRKHTDFCVIEVDKHLVYIKTGKGNKIISSTTSHCGTNNKAILRLNEEVSKYKNDGFIEDVQQGHAESGVFDKAKWHYGGNFPMGLNPYHAYIHTGFFIGWLITNKLIVPPLLEEHKIEINQFLDRKITAPQLYRDQLDGVFDSEYLTEEGINFTSSYYDRGDYLNDYEQKLALSLESLYNVEDTWDNYLTIIAVIDEKYKKWKIETQADKN
jgi:hypothetical protein